MAFKVDYSTKQIPNSSLIYRPDDYAFDVRPTPEGGFTSALFDDLNLELNAAGRVVSVWGLCPHTRWKSADLIPPEAELGAVFFVSDSPLVRGVSVQLNKDKYRPVLVDRASGWVYVAGSGDAASSVRILTGVVLQIDQTGNLSGIWLKPDQLPSPLVSDLSQPSERSYH